jgi:hypothetical protein
MTDDNKLTPAEVAAGAAESIRTLNYSTRDDLHFPGDVYMVLGALSMLAGRLPQTLQQLANFLERQLQDGVIGIDTGTRSDGDPLTAVSASATALLNDAAPAAATLQAALDRAQQAIGSAHYIEPKAR